MRAGKGIGRVFQIRELFSDMTALENVMTGLHKDTETGFFGEAFRLRRAKAEEKIAKERAFEALKFFRLEDKTNRMVTDLSIGELPNRILLSTIPHPFAEIGDCLLLEEFRHGDHRRQGPGKILRAEPPQTECPFASHHREH